MIDSHSHCSLFHRVSTTDCPERGALKRSSSSSCASSSSRRVQIVLSPLTYMTPTLPLRSWQSGSLALARPVLWTSYSARMTHPASCPDRSVSVQSRPLALRALSDKRSPLWVTWRNLCALHCLLVRSQWSHRPSHARVYRMPPIV